ncbi:MAG: hypothetical protein Q7S74_05420 [Nanoarchaeota archaeon]|nr:hypothetical protein [Nanoarchaeota archaeon]
MSNVILDTNIYGRFIEDDEGIMLVDKIVRDDKFVIHNFRLIRDELRNVPQILQIYDRLVKTKMNQDTKEIDKLAKEYYKEYRLLGGNKKINKIIKDFKIVAFASVKNCDLVFSDDEKTLKNPNSINAYRKVNLKRRIRTPSFYNYRELKRSFN